MKCIFFDIIYFCCYDKFMDKNYGLVFQKLRAERGYSIKEIADTVVSNSTISRFENGFSNISIDKFFHLLNNINVSPNEFMIYFNDHTNNPDFFSSLQYPKKYINSHNDNELKKLLDGLEDSVLEFPDNKSLKLQTISFRIALHRMNSKYELFSKDVNFVKQHLLSVPVWGIFELQLYSRSLFAFDDDSLFSLSNRLFSPFDHGVLSFDYLQQFHIALINLTDNIIQRENYEYMERVIHFLKFYDFPELSSMERGVLNFNVGYYHYKIGKQELGEKEIKEVISAFNLLGAFNHATNMKNELDKLKADNNENK